MRKLTRMISNEIIIKIIIEFINSVFEKDRKYVVIDEITLKLIKGSVVDYEQVMIRSAFQVFTNLDRNYIIYVLKRSPIIQMLKNLAAVKCHFHPKKVLSSSVYNCLYNP